MLTAHIFYFRRIFVMENKKNAEISRMFEYAGKYRRFTVLGCILAGISTVLSILPFVCIWFVIRDMVFAFGQGDITLAASSSRYAYLAALFSVLSILIYFIALNCSHLAAFRSRPLVF